MEEIEVKILNVDRSKCETILSNLGAIKKFEGELHALNFDNETKEIKQKKQVLRLRKEGNKQVLCLKEFISKDIAKRMVEIEVDVSDFDKTKLILEKMGFSVKNGSIKHRVSWKLENTIFDFDKYKEEYNFIPEFLEIESDSIKSIKKYAKLLGFKEDELKPWSFKDLLKKLKKDNFDLKQENVKINS